MFRTNKHVWHESRSLKKAFRIPDHRRLRQLAFVAVLVFMTLNILHHKHRYPDYLLRSLKGPLKYDDPELLLYITDNILEPPSKLPYNFQKSLNLNPQSEEFYLNYTKAVFGSKRNGFFVEAGALDGQELSNTLALEVKQGWTGLLVEPDPSSYILLKKRHRKAWTARACLSVYDYPAKEKLSTFTTNLRERRGGSRDMGSIVRERNGTLAYSGFERDALQYAIYESQCFPLGSLLLALNVTWIDLLSLDVEFIEERIIRYLDFERFNIQVLYMEWWDHQKLPWLKKFMETRNFVFQANMEGNIIFAKNNSEAHRKAIEQRQIGKFFLFQVPNSSKR